MSELPPIVRRRRGKQERPAKNCECGRPKLVGVYACDRCRKLESEGFSADTRPRSALVGVKENNYDMGLMALGRACDESLRRRGLIDDQAWRKSNNGITS